MKSSAKLLLIVFLFSSGVLTLKAQNRQLVYPDRPFLTKTPFVVPAGKYCIETGFVYDKLKYTFETLDYTSENLILAQTEFRYGIDGNFEFRATGEFLFSKTTQGNVETDLQGLRGLAIGAKTKLMNEKHAAPDIALLINLNIPFGNDNLRPDKFEPGIHIAFYKNLVPKISLGLSAGGEYQSKDDNAAGKFGSYVTYNLNERFNVFAEFYGTSSKKVTPQQYVHVGIAFLHLNTLKIDFSLGRQIKGIGSEWFGNLGIAVLILN